MSLWERLAEIARGLLTTETEMKHLNAIIMEMRRREQEMSNEIQDVRERLVRLEAGREADRAGAGRDRSL